MKLQKQDGSLNAVDKGIDAILLTATSSHCYDIYALFLYLLLFIFISICELRNSLTATVGVIFWFLEMVLCDIRGSFKHKEQCSGWWAKTSSYSSCSMITSARHVQILEYQEKVLKYTAEVLCGWLDCPCWSTLDLDIVCVEPVECSTIESQSNTAGDNLGAFHHRSVSHG